MRHVLIRLGLLACLASPASAQSGDGGLEWLAVGRLDVAGKGFCTATLIRDRLILTAAHCLFDADGQPVPPDRFAFHAGLDGGFIAASRTVTATRAHPDFTPQRAPAQTGAFGVDIGILELSRPVSAAAIAPRAVTALPAPDRQVAIVSYGDGRENAPDIRTGCGTLGRQANILVMTCDMDHGASGAPVFLRENGQDRIIAIVSGGARMEGADVTLGTELAEALPLLLQVFARENDARDDALLATAAAGQDF